MTHKDDGYCVLARTPTSTRSLFVDVACCVLGQSQSLIRIYCEKENSNWMCLKKGKGISQRRIRIFIITVTGSNSVFGL